jgi:hypothetical protein
MPKKRKKKYPLMNSSLKYSCHFSAINKITINLGVGQGKSQVGVFSHILLLLVCTNRAAILVVISIPGSEGAARCLLQISAPDCACLIFHFIYAQRQGHCSGIGGWGLVVWGRETGLVGIRAELKM